MNIYIGDGSRIMNRIKSQHCSGNVEGSSLRKHVANEMGFQLKKTQRENGNWRVRLDLPNPKIGESQITNYLRTGKWKFVICPIGVEAKDFQFYVIQNISPAPILNINMGNWNEEMLNVYKGLLNKLESCPVHNYNQIINIPNESGIYLFIHEKNPNLFLNI
jgi:hypothetical protein